MDKSINQTRIELIRDRGWMITIKVMPDEVPFIIPGARSEYDNPHPDKEVWHGKTVCELSDMRYRYKDVSKFRGDRTFPGNSIDEVLSKAHRFVTEQDENKEET